MIVQKLSTTKVDMWSLGVILHQFFTNKLPFEADNYYYTMKLIRESELPPLPSTVSPIIKEIITNLLDKNPENRADASDLLINEEFRPHIDKIIA
jgi:NIMA (never in mitosis gene a)-related kinase 1/4/5